MSGPIEELIVHPPEAARIAAIPCPNSYYAYPRLTCLAPVPDAIRPTLESLWSASIHPGRDVLAYRLTDVYVAEEGLVFDGAGQLLSPTRTYHTDDQIRRGHASVLAAIAAGSAPVLDRGVLAKSRGADNYGHFIVEMLPRAWIARTRLGLADWPVLIFDEPEAVRQVATAALQVAGVPAEVIVPLGRAPAFLRELVVIDGLTWHSLYLSPIVMQCLDAVSAAIESGQQADLYATRRPSRTRDFAAEPAIAARLRARGYREIEAAGLSFAEQVAAFKGARSVVGCMGAALTNIVFCRPGTEVVVFTPCGAAEVFFWMIAEARRLRYREIRCAEIGPQLGPLPWDRLIDVPPAALDRLIGAPPARAAEPGWAGRVSLPALRSVLARVRG